MKALRKEIAAALAFTMFTVPLAGCSRTVTKGGLSGRGAVGDFLVGGLYGGVFGGFMRPGQPLPEGAFVVELPRPNDLRLTVELVGMDAMRYYTHARIATEKLSRMNAQNSKPEDYAKLLKETAELWKLADHFADMARQFAKHLSKEEKKPDYKPLAMIDKSPFGVDIFFSVAYAREGTDADEERHRPMTGEERAAMEMHPDWAQGIVDAYKKYPAGKGIGGIADELGVDAKEANRQFQKAVSVLDQDKVFGIPTGMSSQTAGNLYNVGAKTAMVTKTGCQVILCVGGMILSGGALATTAGLAKQTIIVTNMAASFADTSVDIANTGHELIYDKEDKELAEIKKKTGIISAVTSGVTIVTSFGDFALRGKDAVENTHKALEAANVGEYGLFNKYMNTSGVLDKYNIGGEGISAILDSAIWTGERIQDLTQDGEVLGFKVIGGDDEKPVFMPTAIPKGNVSPPIPIDQVAGGTVDLWLTKEQAENRQNAVKELLEDIELLEQQKQEALQQAAKENEPEGGTNSGEASGDIADDSVYAPKNIVGATGSAHETRTQYQTIEIPFPETEPETITERIFTANYTHHFQVVLSKEEAQGFLIEDKVKTLFTPMNIVDNSTHRFHVVSYDSGTGLGKLKCWVPATTKDGIFPFRISGRPGSMTIEIENFVWAPK